MAMTDNLLGGWHLDRRVPIAMIVAIILQTFAIGGWVGTIHWRVGILEEQQLKIEVAGTLREGRVVRAETLIQELRSSMDRIEAKLDRLIERGNQGQTSRP